MDEPRRTYLLAPNLTFLPDGPLALGNVVAHPLKPHRKLAILPREQWPQTAEPLEGPRRIVRARSADVHGDVNADVSAALPVGGHGGAHRSKSSTRVYSMDTLQTIYFTQDPSREALEALVTHADVRYAMDAPFWRRPVYLISGIKIASGLVTQDMSERGAGVDAGASANLAPGLSLGAGAGFDRTRRKEDSGTSQQDVVLAYQLLRITRKGWLRTRLDVDEYAPKAAFLSDDGGGREGDTVAQSDGKVEVESQTIADIDATMLDDVEPEDLFFLE